MNMETTGRTRVPHQHKKPASQDGSPDNDELSYAVELWTPDRKSVEKVVARAFTISLARAIFRAALDENPGRRIVLRHGERIVEDNGE